jgi:predicted membrane chloride channel (bestrophin family)
MKTSIFGLIAALECLLLYHFLSPEQLKGSYTAGAPSLTFPAFAAIVAFLLTFRQTFSYNRFHESRTSVQTMSASMYTVVAYAISFDKTPNKPDETDEKSLKEENLKGNKDDSRLAREQFRYNMVHAMSLLHGICLQHLRCDWDLANLTRHNEDYLPAWDSAGTPGFKIHFWNYFLPRNRVNSRTMFHKVSKIQIIGGITKRERRVLSGLHGGENNVKLKKTVATSISSNSTALQKNDTKPSTFSSVSSSLWRSDNSCTLRGAAERPYELIFSTAELLRRRYDQGGINMPSPVIAQLWAILEKAVDSFERCRSISETPFPFPWAQLIIVVLVSTFS